MMNLAQRSVFRVVGRAVALVAVGGSVASAQMIPNIQKPINTAKRVAGQTSDQVRADQNTGKDGKVGNGVLPAEAAKNAQAAAQKGAPQKTTGAPQKTTGAPQKTAGAPPKGAAQKPVTGAPPKAGQKNAAVSRDSGSTSQAGRSSKVTVYRESFTYDDADRRDPFLSLMLTGELRPVITDLVLTGVFFDPQGTRSIAMLVDNSTGQNYGVRVGQTLGRMKVARIGTESVTFDIDEFGLSRSETLIIDRTKTAAPRRP